ITAGKGEIDKAFAGFNDDYYNKIKQSYLDYYDPQLKDQYNKAVDAVTYDFARKGALNSSAAIKKLADLKSLYGQQYAGIESAANDLVGQQRGSVSENYNNLLDFNTNTADAAAVSERTGGITDRLAQFQVPKTPLASAFTDFLTPALN